MLLVRAKGKYDRTWGKEQAGRGWDLGWSRSNLGPEQK